MHVRTARPSARPAPLAALLGLTTLLAAGASAQGVLNEDAVVSAPPPVPTFEDFAIALDITGNTLVVGEGRPGSLTPPPGRAHVYRRSGPDWVFEQSLTGADQANANGYGHAVAIHGNRAIVGAFERSSGVGGAYVYHWDGAVWSEEALLEPQQALALDRFGAAVDIRGATVAVGAPGRPGAVSPGRVSVFVRTGVEWALEQVLTEAAPLTGDGFGRAVALVDDLLLVGAPEDDLAGADAGRVFVYRRSGTTWTLEDTLVAADASAGAMFGAAVDVSGGTAVVAAPGASPTGAVYLFEESAGSWSQDARLAPAPPAATQVFGGDVALEGDQLLVSDATTTDDGTEQVHVYRRTAGAWTEADPLEPSTALGAPTGYGAAVALDDPFAAVAWPDTIGGGAALLHRLDSPWRDLGGEPETGGFTPQAILRGEGPLTAGSLTTIELDGGLPGIAALAWLSYSSAPIDALGGRVHAFPPDRQFLFFTDAAAQLSLGVQWPAGIPAGFEFWIQFILDATNPPHELLLSNAITATTP